MSVEYDNSLTKLEADVKSLKSRHLDIKASYRELITAVRNKSALAVPFIANSK